MRLFAVLCTIALFVLTLLSQPARAAGSPKLTIETHEERLSTVISYNPTGSLIGYGGESDVSVWNSSTGAKVSVFHGTVHLPSFYWLDNHRIVVIDDVGRLVVWDGRSGRSIRTLTQTQQQIASIAVSPHRVFIVFGIPGTALLFDARTLTLVRRIAISTSSKVYPRYSFDTDRRLVVSFAHNETYCYDTHTGAAIPDTRLPNSLQADSRLLMSPDSSRIVTWSEREPAVTLWDGKSGQPLYTLDELSLGALAMAFSRDSRYLAGGDAVGNVVIWLAKTGKPLATLTGHTQIVSGLAFSPDGSTLASAAGDGTIRIWKAPKSPMLHRR